jgi:C-terminal processing protease CtpA/Prc
MKKPLLFLLLTISLNLSAQAQLSEVQKYKQTALVWGFLKYYHPEVAKGNYNWDEQLLTILPKIESASNKEELSKIYLDWINSLGTIKECKACSKNKDKEYFDKNFDLSWMQDTNYFSDELITKLKYIENNRHQGKKYYVEQSNIGYIITKNEPVYENFEYPNKNYRLLSLFKYWNTIEYFYPYKYLTDQNWNDVLLEMIPKFINSQNANEYHLAMLETVVKLDDSHGIFKTNKTFEYFGTKFIPAKLKIIDNKAVVIGFYNDSLSKLNDFKIGDVIYKINNQEIDEIFNSKKKYISGSNYNSKIRDSYYTLTNGNTDSLSLVVERDGVVKSKISYRYDVDLIFKSGKENPSFKILDGNIGYINLENLKIKEVDEMMLQLKNCKGIIIDLRNYPNFLPYNISNYLNSERKEFAKIIEPNLDYPGKFIWKSDNSAGGKNNDYYKGKVILLVNENTQSRGEFATMILQTGNNVVTIGSQTAGADGNVCNAEFIGGYKSLMSGIGVFYPDGTETQRKGLHIDYTIKESAKNYDSDLYVKEAIKLIEN